MQRPRVVLFTIRAGVGEPEPDVPPVVDLLGRPDPLVESKVATMEMVGVVVGGQLESWPFSVNCPKAIRLA